MPMDPAESDLVYILLSGSIISLFLTISVVLFVFFYQRRVMRQRLRLQVIQSEHQAELMRSMLETQENERRRIAKDLHDDIGAVLSAAKLNLDLLGRRASRQAVEPDQLKEVGQVVSGAIGDLRRISHDLMPPALEADGLVVALQVFFNKIEQATGINCEFSLLERKLTIDRDEPLSLGSKGSLSSEGLDLGIPGGQSLSIYRMVQEMTNNSLKHAACQHIRCQLSPNPGGLEIVYGDDGKGFDTVLAKQARASLGLKSLESRVGALNGSLGMESQPGAGMEVRIQVPIWNT